MNASLDELEFIARLRAIAADLAARGLMDDAAVLGIGAEALVLTHDVMVEGRHWALGQDMADVAWKLVATNLSDLAAKGAEPLGVLIGHTLGPGDDCFAEGLGAVLSEYAVPLLGGDTVAGSGDGKGARTLGCTAIGRATHRPVPDRASARIGDGVFVTGIIGRAMLGLEELGSGSECDLAYRRPRPLLAQGQALAPVVTAMMDVSDGLLLDCWRMTQASGLTFALDSSRVPVADPARRQDCLRWGDDYQLLFTAPQNRDLPVAATRIGKVEAGPAALIVDGAALSLQDGLGYRHG